MGKRIASLYAEIGADTTKLKRGLDESKGLLTQTKDKFNDLKKSILPATGVVVAFGVALGKAWETAKEGAALEYTIQKFDRLSESIGTSSDKLLNDLKIATKGARSDMELTGVAADLMGLGLVKSHDQVVRLVTVVGALGMNTNQLVLTLANKTTMRFDQLGVSVDGFDAKVKNLEKAGLSADEAFGEAFLQQAEEQVKKVGDIADTTAGKMAALEVNVKNLGDAIKMDLVPPVGNLVTTLGVIVSGKEKIQAALRTHEEEVRKTADSYENYVSEMQRAAKAAGYHYDALGSLRDGLNRVQEEHYLYSQALWENGDALDYAGRMAKKLEGDVDDAGTSLDDMGASADTAKEKILGLNDIDLNLAGTVENELKKIDFMLAGGLDLQKITTDIQNAVLAGTITPEQGKALLAEAYVAAEGLEVELGNITADEAAKNVSDTLGVSLTDAKGLVTDVITEMDNIPKDLYVKLHIEQVGNLHGVGSDIGAQELKFGEDLNGNGVIGRAGGGRVTAGSPYVVGEVGPEMFVPGVSGSVISNADLKDLFGKVDSGITVNVYGAADPYETANQININLTAAQALRGV